jgi:hypothetical protein
VEVCRLRAVCAAGWLISGAGASTSRLRWGGSRKRVKRLTESRLTERASGSAAEHARKPASSSEDKNGAQCSHRGHHKRWQKVSSEEAWDEVANMVRHSMQLTRLPPTRVPSCMRYDMFGLMAMLCNF